MASDVANLPEGLPIKNSLGPRKWKFASVQYWSCCTDDRYQSYTYLLSSINRAWV